MDSFVIHYFTDEGFKFSGSLSFYALKCGLCGEKSDFVVHDENLTSTTSFQLCKKCALEAKEKKTLDRDKAVEGSPGSLYRYDL